MWITPEKCQANRKNVRDNRKNVRIDRTKKTPKTRMDKSFAACPRARARKTRKNYLKTQKSFPKLWITSKVQN
jgi:hypothetical protein